MDVLDAIRNRRAVRRYKAQSPSESELRQLIDCAIWAPSAMNDQSWHFTVITRSDLLRRIAQDAKTWLRENEPQLAQNPHLRQVLADPEFDLLHYAPALVIISAPAAGKWSEDGCALAAQNLMLGATGLGLGTCWIGLVQEWLNTSQGRAAIGLPAEEHVVAPIVVGYPQDQPPVTVRNRPAITWIKDDAWVQEDGERLEPIPLHGLFGGLISAS